MAGIDCNDCRKRLYNLETGEPQAYRSGPKREIRYFDGPGHVPPCKQKGGTCPKGTYETAHELELTNQNYSTVKLYRAIRVAGGDVLNEREKQDPLLMDNLIAVDQIHRAWERRQDSRALADAVWPIVAKRM